MEKRAVIAFALSLLVLFLWETFFGSLRHTPPQAPEEKPPISQSAPTPSTPGPSPGSPPPPAPESLPGSQAAAPAQQVKNWKVDASLFNMDISGAGARIQGVQLDKYKERAGADAPPMELIPSRSTGYLPLSVDLLQHPDWQLSTRPFTSNSPENVPPAPQGAAQTLTLSSEVPGQVRVTKVFSFVPNSYVVDVDIQLQNLSSQALSDQLAVSFYYEPYDQNENSYNLSYWSVFQNGKVSKYQVKDLAKKSLAILPPYDWVGYENNYFLNAFIPTDENASQVVPKVLDADKGLIQTVYLSAPFQLEGSQQKDFKMQLYLGPKELDRLDQGGHNLSSSVEYGWFGFVARPLLHVLVWLYKYVHNYGVAIIILTVIIKILFWPLTQKSYKSMQAMKKLQPKIAQIREKYKDDREKMNQELMMVYRTYKVNPLGGCLPMVLQIPVFFALYRMLGNSVELLHQPFVLWIHDLTAPDRLNIGVPIPYLGGIPVLTILMGVTMFIQQKMTPSTGDPRQEQMMLLMPVMFTFFFINFPAGLVLYWFVNNVLSIVQQYLINRQA